MGANLGNVSEWVLGWEPNDGREASGSESIKPDQLSFFFDDHELLRGDMIRDLLWTELVEWNGDKSSAGVIVSCIVELVSDVWKVERNFATRSFRSLQK